MIPCIKHPWNDKITEMENRSVVAKVWGSGGVGREVDVTLKGNRKGLCSDGYIHCGYPGCDTVRVLQDVTSFTRWNWVKGIEDLCYFLKVCVNLCEEVKVLVAQLCLTLWDPMDCSPLGSSVHGILQARTPEWTAIPFFRGSSWPSDWTWVSCIADEFFTVWTTREAWVRL